MLHLLCLQEEKKHGKVFPRDSDYIGKITGRNKRCNPENKFSKLNIFSEKRSSPAEN